MVPMLNFLEELPIPWESRFGHYSYSYHVTLLSFYNKVLFFSSNEKDIHFFENENRILA
jgi:hypothetical protein